MSSSYQPRSNQRPEDQESDVNIAELVGTAALAGVGLGGIAGLALKRKANTAKSTQQINEFLNKARQQRKSPGATSGVKQADLSNVDVTPSKTPTRMKEVYQEAAQPVEINKTPQLTGSTSVVRPNTFVDDYTREITERRLGEQQVEDALQVLNLTRESRSERARQAANVRRVQAAAADDIIDELRSQRTVDQTASAINSGAGQQTGRTKHRLQSNEDVVLRKVEQSEDLVDAALQKQVQQQNIPLENTPKRDAAIDLVSSGLPDGTPVDQAEIVATGQGSVQRKQVLENANLPSGSSSVSDLSTPNVAKKPALSEVDVDELKYWNSPAGKEELLDTSADLAFMDSDIGKKAAAREKIYDAQGIKYDYRNDIEAWKDNWKAQHTVDPETLKVVPKPAAIVKTGETIKVDPGDSQQFVAKQLSLFDPRPQSFELQDAVANFDSKVQQLMTGSGMSRARAESLVLGDKKMTTTQGRQLKEKLEQDLLDETGVGTTTGISGRFLKSVDNIETGQKTALDREIRGRARNLDQGELPEAELRSLGSIQGSTVNEADIADVAGGIVGPSTIDLSKRATGQTLQYTGNRPANVQKIPVVEDQPVIVKRKVVNPQTGQEETQNILTRGTPIQTESLPLGTSNRAPRGPVRTVPEGPRPNIVRTSTGLKKGEGDFVVMDGKKVQRETLTGYGPYGTETGKYISGAMDKEGKYSNEAIGAVAQGPGEPLLDAGATFKDAEGKTRFLRNQPGAPQPRKPSEPLFGPNMGVNERESFKGVPNKGLERIVSQGTYRSGKVSKPARAAQREQKRRAEFNYDPTKISSEDVKTSLQASEEMRRARIEGRNPQEALKTFMQNKGLM